MREIVLANPAVDFDGLVFVKQFAAHGAEHHAILFLEAQAGRRHLRPGRSRAGGRCASCSRPAGAGLRLGAGPVVGRRPRGVRLRPAAELAAAVDTANYRIEGENVFRLRKQQEPLHLFEVRLDGSDLEQLTDDPYWSDFEPTYCADGDIVFASDRCGRSAECGNDTYDHTNPNLYVMSADGSNVRQWTDSKDIDRYPHSLDDGRIAYTHWEYQERHFMEVHALWTARPDGTMSDALFKHHMRAPCGLRDTRSIPGSTKLVSIATGHHTFAYGPVVIVDPASGMNNEAGLRIVTPGVTPQEGPDGRAAGGRGRRARRGGLYQTPWALSEKCFLVVLFLRPSRTARRRPAPIPTGLAST